MSDPAAGLPFGVVRTAWGYVIDTRGRQTRIRPLSDFAPLLLPPAAPPPPDVWEFYRRHGRWPKPGEA